MLIIRYLWLVKGVTAIKKWVFDSLPGGVAGSQRMFTTSHDSVDTTFWAVHHRPPG